MLPTTTPAMRRSGLVTTTATQEADKNTRREPWIVTFYRSEVGKKWIMAITGIFLLLYVLAHMLGNLKVFFGPEEINEYGEALRDLGGHLVPRTHLLWIMRIGLTLTFAVHIVAAYQLAIRARRTRGPVKYEASRHWVASNYASRTMRWTGTIVLLFLLFHLADLTWGTPAPPATSAFERGEVYANLVASLSRPIVSGIYIVANIALGFHIYHGTWSLFQSIGANNTGYNQARRTFAAVFTAIIVVGNLSIPIAVLTGVIA
jgi:succinate dehydrogenase / fumarate reductase cytochrome b subunit